MAIDFKPEQNDYTNLTPFKTWLIYQINTWGVNNFPFLENDFDQLTNYGMMMKLMKAMNDTISNQNKVEDDMSKLYIAFTELQTYVNDYFDNLDVQEEINNKLDEMAESGELNQFIKKLDYYEITNQTEDEIQAIMNLETAKVISFKNDYTFTKTMILNKNTTVLLNNNTLTFNIPSYNEDYTLSHGFFNFNSTDSFTEYNGNSNISILNGTIIGGNLSFCHANNITIENIYFKNCLNNHILEMAGINNLHVNNCKFEGIPISNNSSTNYLEYIQLDFMQYNDFPWFDENSITYDGTINKNWIIENSEFIKPDSVNFTFYNAIGQHNFIQNEYHQNITIRNNKFINMGNSGIVLYAIENSKIDNNYFEKDDYTSLIEGSMIQLRNVCDNLDITNNTFNGGYRAIECLRLHYNKHNLIIENNNFNNYIVGTAPIIQLFNIQDSKINNNSFNNFINTAIRVDAHLNDGNYNGHYYIENNIFSSTSTLIDNTIKTYMGNPHINNNIFNCSLTSDKYAIALPSTSDATLENVYIENNKIINGYTDKIIILNGNSAANIKDIPFLLYSGNVNSLTNQEMNYKMNNFNRIYITFGGGSGTTIHELKPWTPKEKIDGERTYRLTGGKSDGSLIVFNVSINTTANTITYTTTESGSLGNIKSIYAYNE